MLERTITLYDGSKVLGSAVVDANGKWSIKPAMDLAVGLHDLYATEKNLAGTVGPQSAHVALTIDLTNVHFTLGIQFQFPAGFSLAPGARALVARDLPSFTAAYPSVPPAQIAGVFANGPVTALIDWQTLTVRRLVLYGLSSDCSLSFVWPSSTDVSKPMLSII